MIKFYQPVYQVSPISPMMTDPNIYKTEQEALDFIKELEDLLRTHFYQGYAGVLYFREEKSE